jgi:hypothetical protein
VTKNLPASVRQRLTNKAKETNRLFQELLLEANAVAGVYA